MPAIVGSGTLVLDPHVRVIPNGTASPIAPGVTVTMRTIPSLRALGGPVGGTVVVDLFAPAGGPYLLLVGLPTPPVPLTTLHGSLWVHGLVPVESGSIPAVGRTATTVHVPSGAELFARAFTWQALHGAATSGRIALSNPSTCVDGF